MAQNIRVHMSTETDRNGKTRPVALVETTIPLRLEASDLANGLGSRYIRYGKAVPEALTQRDVLKIYREELLCFGSAGLSWGDAMGFAEQEGHRLRLLALIVHIFPGMRGYER